MHIAELIWIMPDLKGNVVVVLEYMVLSYGIPAITETPYLQVK